MAWRVAGAGADAGQEARTEHRGDVGLERDEALPALQVALRDLAERQVVVAAGPAVVVLAHLGDELREARAGPGLLRADAADDVGRPVERVAVAGELRGPIGDVVDGEPHAVDVDRGEHRPDALERDLAVVDLLAEVPELVRDPGMAWRVVPPLDEPIAGGRVPSQAACSSCVATTIRGCASGSPGSSGPAGAPPDQSFTTGAAQAVTVSWRSVPDAASTWRSRDSRPARARASASAAPGQPQDVAGGELVDDAPRGARRRVAREGLGHLPEAEEAAADAVVVRVAVARGRTARPRP